MSRLKCANATSVQYSDDTPNPREKDDHMSEPISGTAAGIFGWKLLGSIAVGGFASGLATYVVMSMTKPKTDQEWRVALACTLFGSLFGGAAFIRYLGIQNWVDDVFGIMGIGGIMFTCGLPSWLLVRAAFLYMERNKDKDIKELAKDIKDAV